MSRLSFSQEKAKVHKAERKQFKTLLKAFVTNCENPSIKLLSLSSFSKLSFQSVH